MINDERGINLGVHLRINKTGITNITHKVILPEWQTPDGWTRNWYFKCWFGLGKAINRMTNRFTIGICLYRPLKQPSIPISKNESIPYKGFKIFSDEYFFGKWWIMNTEQYDKKLSEYYPEHFGKKK